jgi:uncharacterized membrane protein
MTFALAALLIGIVAGLRAMTAPAVVSWAVHLGWLPVDDSWTAFMGWRFTPWIFTVLAAAELVTDKLPTTPSRKLPMPFAARLVSGALCGATVGAAGSMMLAGLVAGIVGAAIGTYGGAWARGRLAAAFGRDFPAAILEDIVAIGGGLVIVALPL